MLNCSFLIDEMKFTCKIPSMKKICLWIVLPIALLAAACGVMRENALKNESYQLWSFGQDLSFFSKYGVDTVILGEGESLVCVSPEWQGRVMTSTFSGIEGSSIGWINRPLIAFKKDDLQMSQAGGEDRFWIGPQAGEFSVFAQTSNLYSNDVRGAPDALSVEPWKLVSRTSTRARLEKEAKFENALGKVLSVKAEREVSVLNRANVGEILGLEIPESVSMVAYQSFNKLTNTGDAQWSEKTGMLNISVQSCFNANRSVNVFVPYERGELSKLGNIVSDDFYDSSTEGRLYIEESFIRFKTDGKSLSAIGVSQERSQGIVLSYDMHNNILTVVIYIRPSEKMRYLASSWRRSMADNGDAVSVFNNGTRSQGSFGADAYYEISTHSPALSLSPGKSQFHIQRTFHFSGSEYDLGIIAYKLAGITMAQLRGERPE